MIIGACAMLLGFLREVTPLRPGKLLADLLASHSALHPGMLMFCGGAAMMAVSLSASRRVRALRVLPRTAALKLPSAALEHAPAQAAVFNPAAGPRFAKALAAAVAPPAPCAVVVMDIDGFHRLRRACGDDGASELASRIGARLSGMTPPGALLAQLAPDEFAMLLPGTDDAAARVVAARLLARACGPLSFEGRDVDVAASIGVAMAPAHGDTAERLLTAARMALALAKADGGRDWRMFDTAQCQAAQERARLRAELRPALEAGQFVPYYQPIVSLRTGEIVGMEVLARWRHPRRGLLTPDLFIHQIEAQRLCGVLSLCLLRQVVVDARQWPSAWAFAFNASACQLRELLGFIIDANQLSNGTMAAHRIELEVTETALIEDMGLARAAVQSMHRAGAKVVLDDFGTGYANFLQLRELPFDRIKIDRSFVADMQVSARTDACLKAMLGLARSLGASVIAEGVENEAAESKLRAMGCDFAQGYYYSPPVPAEGVPLLIRRAESRAKTGLVAA
jgi:diguanylate cyclase (GGDEF)-like protein